MPPLPMEPSQKSKPWPGYFLVRTTGEVVPLIAVDELPKGLDLVGIPRSLDLEETIGMLNLGLQQGTGSYYKIVARSDFRDNTSNVDGRAKTESTPATTQALPKSSNHDTAPMNVLPSSPKTDLHTQTISQIQATILCRHWCHHGICKWGQQCRYQHNMPMNLQGLQEVGLADWPTWYRKMNPGYFANEVHAAGPNMLNTRSGRFRVCNGGSGNGGACCGALHGAKGDRRPLIQNRVLRERALRATKSEELGEQIIARLRGMAKDTKVNAVGKGTTMVERASVRETRNWEDESEESEDERVAVPVQKVEEAKGKLVDV